MRLARIQVDTTRPVTSSGVETCGTPPPTSELKFECSLGPPVIMQPVTPVVPPPGARVQVQLGKVDPTSPEGDITNIPHGPLTPATR
mmetsp:Transcript_59006/g.120878  ORF Transcript_59006/g.120878 Transcript_59006/m.120878 type:complete len:87 (+) Transcript_59006:182-442(+)